MKKKGNLACFFSRIKEIFQRKKPEIMNKTDRISINNDIKPLKMEEFQMNLSFINNEAIEFFSLENLSDFDELLKNVIVFSEKPLNFRPFSEKPDKKEKIGDLKEEMLKIFTNFSSSSIKASFSSQILLDSEYKLKNKGENSHFLINLLPFFHNKTLSFLVYFENISEKLEIERLLALDAYKNSIMANVTHDLRAPLQGIMAFIDVFEEKKLNENEVLLINIARKNLSMMACLIADILDDNQIKMGKIKLNLTGFFLKEFIEDIVNFIRIIAKEKFVEILWKIRDFTDVLLYSDQIRLKQVLINLINNSLKFTPKNGKIMIEVSKSFKKPRYLCFEVKDTGSGIPKEIIDQLFKPYASFQGKNGVNKQGFLLKIL